MFDSLSFPERKNPQGAITAFKQARAEGNIDAHLVIKVSNLDKTPEHTRELRQLVQADSSITLIEGYLEGDDIFRLIDCCDVFLSLHRAEGFGLGLAEAMLLGKVVIATNWSGNLKFMSGDNSLLIDYQLVEIEEDYGPYKQGQLWAEPDLKAASAAIERVCKEPELRQLLGEKAHRTISTNFSTRSIGQQIRQRLVEIDPALAETG
jgi:glycosyltransferase involved in cell wall biosynthesis